MRSLAEAVPGRPWSHRSARPGGGPVPSRPVPVANFRRIRSPVERARRPIEARRTEHERQLQELSDRWDRLFDAEAPAAERRDALEALRDRLLERSYINNLLAGIERELEADKA